MRKLTPDEQELLDNRKRSFEAFHEERMPVLVHFMEVLSLPEPGLVLVHAERYLPPLDQWLQRQTINDEHRAWLGARVTYFVGEYFAQMLNGYWLVNEYPDTRTFARYVIGGFSRIPNSNAMLDPFSIADECLAEPPGRSLTRLLAEGEQQLMKS
ncbi:MAG TPA: hypothetical protein VGM98_03260 [Schlesneria sp.]|jgi:hypothetical protein